ncbi:MAG: ribosome-recycling factor [Candidatus Binatia bacterium]|nr:MAG: ribosome-recycling factor [Candidatus Binatia bacterium]
MVDEVLADMKKEMDQTVASFRKELARTRTGRASPALLEGLTVEYYGTKTPLIQLAGISAPEPRLLVVQPYDKGALGSIEKAILQSDLGLTPVNDGKILRIPIPELTEERRRDLVRHVRRVAEEFRISIRNHRRDAIEMLREMEKEKEITEDDFHRAQERVEETTREYIGRIDKMLKAKEEEILEV